MPGIIFPQNEKGERSTTSFNKIVFSKMAEKLPAGDELVRGIVSEKDWRHKYDKHLTALFEAQVSAAGSDDTRQLALDSLSCGLEQATALQFERADGTTVLLSEEMAADASTLTSAVVRGTGEAMKELVVPYKGGKLQGSALADQLQAWATYGTMEADCADAIREASGKMSSLQGKSFVILGAGSELGPLRYLLRAGATVYAVGTKKPQRWADLIEFTKGTAGTLVVPVPAGQSETSDVAQVAGADLLADPCAVKSWVLKCLETAKGNVTLGTYLYADSDANVRITAAADYIIAAASKLGPERVSFAWLGSPSTAHVIPAECSEAQSKNVELMSWWQKAMPYTMATPSQVWCGSSKAHIFSGYVVMQGPNYALAQHMRQWRAMVLESAGFTVSSPMAPACRTESVCKNQTMAKLLDGMAYFPPCEAFDADTANALLFCILVSDVTGQKPTPLPSAFHLFIRKSFHGGAWRTPYNIESTGKTTYLLGRFRPLK